jgi:hypothetical protein
MSSVKSTPLLIIVYSKMIKNILRLATPGFYKETFATIVKNNHTQMVAGSPAPLFKAMLLVGVVGYAMEYQMVGSKYFFPQNILLIF